VESAQRTPGTATRLSVAAALLRDSTATLTSICRVGEREAANAEERDSQHDTLHDHNPPKPKLGCAIKQ
jgi:hypothetical protein